MDFVDPIKAALPGFGAGTLLILSLSMGAVLLFTRWRRLGRILVLLAALDGLVTTILPVGGWILADLENRFPAIPPPDRVDGIVVLGGALVPHLSAKRRQPAINDAGERLFALARLLRLYPGAKVVYTGGEVDWTREVLAWIGDADRISFEGTSSSTREDALRARELARPAEGERWLLVTSAYHMPRAVAVFRAIGWRIIPYPVDYRTRGDYEFDLSTNLNNRLQIFDLAASEWVATLVYRLNNWVIEIYPK